MKRGHLAAIALAGAGLLGGCKPDLGQSAVAGHGPANPRRPRDAGRVEAVRHARDIRRADRRRRWAGRNDGHRVGAVQGASPAGREQHRQQRLPGDPRRHERRHVRRAGSRGRLHQLRSVAQHAGRAAGRSRRDRWLLPAGARRLARKRRRRDRVRARAGPVPDRIDRADGRRRQVRLGLRSEQQPDALFGGAGPRQHRR